MAVVGPRRSIADQYASLAGIDASRLARNLSPVIKAFGAQQAALGMDTSSVAAKLNPVIKAFAAQQAALGMDAPSVAAKLNPVIKAFGAQQSRLAGASLVNPVLRDAARKAWEAGAPSASSDEEVIWLPSASAVENVDAVWSRLQSEAPQFTEPVDASLDPAFTTAQRRWVRGVILTMLITIAAAAPAVALMVGTPLAAAISGLVNIFANPWGAGKVMGWIERPEQNDED